MAASALLPVYLAVGPDEVKREAAVDRLKKRLEASGMADFNLDVRDMTKDPDIDDITGSLNTYPMGADFRLVILEGCDKLAEPVREGLVAYVKNPAPTTVLLTLAAQMAKNTRLYKAVAAIDKKAVIDCAAKKGRELPLLVQGMARRHGKEISLDAAEELIARAGDGTRMLDNELKRLAQMVDAPRIERGDVERLVVRTAEVKPWDFLNAVAARDLPRALELYRLQPPKSEVRLFSLLCTRLRELMCAKALDQRGQGRELAHVLGLQGWQVRNHLGWARRFTFEELEAALAEAVDVEAALKGSRDGQVAFTVWISHIAGKRTAPPAPRRAPTWAQ